MARIQSLAVQWEKEIIRVIQLEVPKVIVEKKMKPLARSMWINLIAKTARDTGRLQHFYTPHLVVGSQHGASAEAPSEIFTSARIRQKDYYPVPSLSIGSVEAEKIVSMRQLYVITSGIPYADEVELGVGKNYTKPKMMQRTADFVVRNAKIIMR